MKLTGLIFLVLCTGAVYAQPVEEVPNYPENARPLPAGMEQPDFIEEALLETRSACEITCDQSWIECSSACDAALREVDAQAGSRGAHSLCIKPCSVVRESCRKECVRPLDE